MKVVINNCWGGFGLSDEALAIISKMKGKKVTSGSFLSDEARLDKDLVAVVEKLGDKSWGDFAELKIVEVNEPFRIKEFDGAETIELLSQVKFTNPFTVGK